MRFSLTSRLDPARIAGLLTLARGLFVFAAETPAPVRLTFAELAACPLVVPAAQQKEAEWTRALSETIRAANGKAIEITGYMLPLAVEHGLARQFLLMRNQNTCCFGQAPSPAEYLVAECAAPGVRVQMDTPVAFTGRLRIAPLSVGGNVVQFYTLESVALAPDAVH